MYKNEKLEFLANAYGLLIRTGSWLQSLVLLYFRITWGHQLFLAGKQKLSAIGETAAFFASLHIPAPLFHAYLVGWLEWLGGILLVLGLASRLISLPLLCIFLVAFSTAHAPEISNFRYLFEPMQLVKQAPYPFFLTTLLVFTFGPGKISLDAWIKRWLARQPKI